MRERRWEISDDDWAEFQMLRIQVSVLREACQKALDWLNGLRITEGSKRHRLRDYLQLALDSSLIKRKRTP